MSSGELVNFNVLAVIIIISGFLFGYYYGFFRQLKNTFKIVIPLILLHFFLDDVLNLLLKINFVSQIKNSSFFTDNSLLFSLIVAGIFFLVIYLLLSLLFKLVSFSKHNLQKKKIISRVFASLLSVINTYVYLFLSLYLLSTVSVVKPNGFFSSFVGSADISIFDLSKLYVYQEKMPYEYQELHEAVSKVSGRSAYDEYQNIIDIFEELEEANVYCSEVLVPNLSEASINRINSDMTIDNYLVRLMEMGENRTLFHYVLLNETDNPRYDEFYKFYEELLEKRGYVYLFYQAVDNSFSSYSFEEIYSVIEKEKDNIISMFLTDSEKESFNEKFLELKFYNDYNLDLSKLCPELTEGYDLKRYLNVMEEKFQSDYVSNFCNSYIDTFLPDKINEIEDKEVFLNLRKNFLIFQTIENDLTETNNMPFELKVVLFKEYDNLFENKDWQKNILIKNFISDSVSSKNNKGNLLYINYLTYEYFFDEEITLKSIEDGVLSINDLSRQDIISDNAKYSLFESIFAKDEGLIYKLVDSKVIDRSLIDEILSSNNIDESVKSLMIN